MQCDVLVIGSGAAALSAALRAAKGGLSVVVAEKSGLLGGTSAMSGAGIWIPANHLAHRAGVADSEVEACEYIRSVAPPGWSDKEEKLWEAFVRNAPRMLKFLSDATPIKFELVDQADPFSESPGGKTFGRMVSPRALSRAVIGRMGEILRGAPMPHVFTYREIYAHDIAHHPYRAVLRLWPKLLWRFVTDAGGQGTALVVGLTKGCFDAQCKIFLEMEAVKLLSDDEGTGVAGAEFRTSSDRMLTVWARHGVVLATGGFEWDTQRLGSYFPGPAYRIGSAPTNTGDGQRMAEALGAELDRMDQANIYLCYPSRSESTGADFPVIFHAVRHAILVDRTGKRFVSEGAFNLGEQADERDAHGSAVHLPVWLVGDARFSPHGAARLGARFMDSMSGLLRADSLGELARKMNVPPEALVTTVSRFNGFCEVGADLDFKRGESVWERRGKVQRPQALARLGQSPFLAIPMDRLIVGTKGGARTNEQGQVLRPDGSVIPRLFAAGLAMANPFGTKGIGAGTTLGPNLTWGYICAETILEQSRP